MGKDEIIEISKHVKRVPGGKRNAASSKTSSSESSTVQWLAQNPDVCTNQVLRKYCVEFPTVHNDILEAAYQRFLKDPNRNTVTYKVEPYTYVADFSKRRQF